MAPLSDAKEALNSSVKPDLSHVRRSFMIYTARNCEYGNDKYERANYLRPVSPFGYTGAPVKEDFVRFRTYLRAVISHTTAVLDSMELHQSQDPLLQDMDGMCEAAFAADFDKCAKVGPSMLPHIGGACASLMMAIEQAVLSGLLPADPGTPWRNK